VDAVLRRPGGGGCDVRAGRAGQGGQGRGARRRPGVRGRTADLGGGAAAAGPAPVGDHPGRVEGQFPGGRPGKDGDGAVPGRPAGKKAGGGGGGGRKGNIGVAGERELDNRGGN